MKKLFTLTLALALIVSTTMYGFVYTNNELQNEFFPSEDLMQDETFVSILFEEVVSHYGEEFIANLHQARINDGKLMSLFGNNMRITEDNDSVYPDFIGGIYYNDNGNMVVQIVQNAVSRDTALYGTVKNFLAEADDIIVEYVKFSYNELKAAIEVLNVSYLVSFWSEDFNNLESFGVDTRNNRIVVYLNVYNEEEIARFKNEILDSPMISFFEAYEPLVNFNEIRPGMDLGGASAGYRVRHNATGRLGFVTAAHSVTP